VTDVAIVHTTRTHSHDAGRELGSGIYERFAGEVPDAVIIFASSRHDYETLLEAINASCTPAVMIGCSSAGEFTSVEPQEGTACAIALRSRTMHFSTGIARAIGGNSEGAAHQIASSFRGLDHHEHLHRSALLLTDALAGQAADFIDHLMLRTSGTYKFFGGGAGDDARFHRTHVFHGTEAVTDAAVALEILSDKPVGVGVAHGWTPSSPPLRVTESTGMRLVSLNSAPAVEAFEEHAGATSQRFDRADPMPFFLHNVLGIRTIHGYQLRVPLAIHADGSLSCAADVPEGAIVHIMEAGGLTPEATAATATAAALDQMQGHRPAVGIVFDCVATRLRLGRDFGLELTAIGDALGTVPYAGCNTYGQVARTDGQFSGFHNCTAVVCALPD